METKIIVRHWGSNHYGGWNIEIWAARLHPANLGSRATRSDAERLANEWGEVLGLPVTVETRPQ